MTICILGRQPKLGLAELETIFGAEHITPLRGGLALVDLPYQQVIDRPLGGSIKVAEVVDELKAADWANTGRRLVKLLTSQMKSGDGKITFGLSVLGMPARPKDIERTGLMIKRELKKTDRPVRLVGGKEASLSSATVLHNSLTAGDNNFEWLIINTGQVCLVARGRYVQDIDSYSKRDFGRPKRDAFVGMLPPKLAQIMINLATGSWKPPAGQQREANSHIPRLLDPFCGTGVVLQEAALMGLAVYGTDLSKKMIDYSRDNLVWLEDQYGLAADKYFEVADAQSHDWRSPIDFVVCEGYLGQPFSAEPAPEKLQSAIYECNQIMRNFLKNLGPQLTTGSRLCVGMPAWFVGDHTHHLAVLSELDELGFERHKLQHVQSNELIYHRQDQVVGRELVVLTKT